MEQIIICSRTVKNYYYYAIQSNSRLHLQTKFLLNYIISLFIDQCRVKPLDSCPTSNKLIGMDSHAEKLQPMKETMKQAILEEPDIYSLNFPTTEFTAKGNYQMNITSAWKYIFLHNSSNISRKKVFWDYPDQDKWFNISRIMVQQANRWIHRLAEFPTKYNFNRLSALECLPNIYV